MKKLTLTDFIARAREVHGYKYNYTKVAYVNSYTKVNIICNKCKNTFEQVPNKHLAGQNGCCFNTNIPMTTQMFVNRAKELHGNKYSYAELVYVNSKTPVKIICTKCGKLCMQRPLEHLKGSDCCRCYTKNLTYTTKEFIHKANKVHGNIYDYSESVYTGGDTPVKVRCTNCNNIFYPTPNNHINKKSGCPSCYLLVRTYSKDEFIHVANITHNNFFNYDKTEYINTKTNIVVTCPIHGEFITSPRGHISHKYGCPKCTLEGGSGENSIHWKGGLASEPYCDAWQDKTYKESIRTRDNNVCQNPYCYKTTKKLHIHHIDYDKNNCHPNNLITVCGSCNSKANFDRQWHTAWYKAIRVKKKSI
jgi:phage FluMu protein Com